MKETKLIKIENQNTTYLDTLLNEGWEIASFSSTEYSLHTLNHYVLLIRTKE